MNIMQLVINLLKGFQWGGGGVYYGNSVPYLRLFSCTFYCFKSMRS